MSQAIEHNLNGVVKNIEKEFISGAVVKLLTITDTSKFITTKTDSEGRFEFFNFKSTDLYRISIHFIGYKTINLTKASVQENKGDLGIFFMEKAEHKLKQIEIVGHKALIERKIDRLIYNVSSANSNNSTLDILRKTPSVFVDLKDKIMINGKSNPKILIDDKPLEGSSEDISNVLKNINGSQIEKIEIISNPSSEFDASGTGGIINIILKKNKDKGLSSNFTGGLEKGKKSSANTGANIDYNIGKVGLFLIANYKENNLPEYTLTDKTSNEARILENNTDLVWNRTLSYRLGIDYKTGNNSNLNFVIRQMAIKETINTIDNSEFYINNHSFIDTVMSINNRMDNNLKQLSANGTYKIKFDTTGNRSLTFSINRTHYSNASNTFGSTSYFNTANQKLKDGTQQAIYLPYNVNMTSAKIDYKTNLFWGLKFSSGLKSGFVKIINDSKYLTFDQDYILDPDKSNYFEYQERIDAGYINLSKTLFKSLQFQLGLREEHTFIKSKLLTNSNQEELNKRSYWNLFPNVLVNYQVNSDQLYGSYSSRINRPNYHDLNPFSFEVYPYLFQKGNTNLKPEISNDYEVGYLLKSAHSLSFGYTKSTDVISSLPLVTNSITTIIKQNLNTLNQYNLTLSSTFRITNFWDQVNNLTGLSKRYSILNEYSSGKFKNSFIISTTNTFAIDKYNKIEVSGSYNSPSVDGIYNTSNIYWVYASYQTTFFKKHPIIASLALDDAFGTFKESNYSNFDGQITKSTYKRDSQRVLLSLSYALKHGKTKTLNKYKDVSDTEQGRIK